VAAKDWAGAARLYEAAMALLKVLLRSVLFSQYIYHQLK